MAGNIKTGWDIVEEVTPFLYAVGRIPGRGSCILISRPDATRGILLTTSFVLRHPYEASGVEAVFFEDRTLGTGLRVPPRPVAVQLRPEVHFFTSAAPRQASAASASAVAIGGADGADADAPAAVTLGYTVVACDVYGRAVGSTRGASPRVRPVPAPAATTAATPATEGPSSPGPLPPPPPPPRSRRPIPTAEAPDDAPREAPTTAAAVFAAAASAAAAPAARRAVPGHATAEFGPHRRDDTIASALPLLLPLVVSKVPPIRAGDQHLAVTHVNGRERRYYVLTVSADGVHDNYCTYDGTDAASHFASGGPVFGAGGDFVGIHHQHGDVAVCMSVRDVVVHLFYNAGLGPCAIPVADSDPESNADADPHAPAASAACRMRAENERLETGGLSTADSGGDNFGCGDYIVPNAVFEQRRAVRSGFVRETAVVRTHLEIWEEWFLKSGTAAADASGGRLIRDGRPQGSSGSSTTKTGRGAAHAGGGGEYRNLILLLHAFPTHTKLVTLVMHELTSHEQRHNIASVASLGGIGVVLEAIDSHPYNEAVMLAGMTALGRLSLYPENADALARCEAATVTARLLAEYCHSDGVQQWGQYCLLNLCRADAARAADTTRALLRAGGVRLVARNLQRFPSSRYVFEWGAALLAVLVQADATAHRECIAEGVCAVAFEGLVRFARCEAAAAALCTLLVRLTAVADPASRHGGKGAAAAAAAGAAASSPAGAAIDYLCSRGVLGVLASALRDAAAGENDAAALAAQAAHAAANILVARQDLCAAATEAGLEEALAGAAARWPSDPPVHAAVARALGALGVAKPAEKYPHIRVGIATPMD